MNCSGSRALATRRDCFRPMSFSTVSTLDTGKSWWGTDLSLYDASSLLSVMSEIVVGGYVLVRFAMTDEQDLRLSTTS